MKSYLVCGGSIHFQHIQNHLRISRAHAQEVCLGLESDGIIGAFSTKGPFYRKIGGDTGRTEWNARHRIQGSNVEIDLDD